MGSNFEIREHVIPAQHVRELPNALAIDPTNVNPTVRLHVKQYIPKNNPQPKPGDFTIIAFHANGFCKEVYEPLWESLLTSLPSARKIRGIWIADVAQQGGSYLLNETKLGDGFSWDDHARDVLHMVNHFRKEMPPPFLGVGHSMGSVMLVKLATLHPGLFHSVALLDPWFYTTKGFPPINPAHSLKPLLYRKDVFPSEEKAREALQGNPLFKNWDKKVLSIYLDHQFREIPTMLYPSTRMSNQGVEQNPDGTQSQKQPQTPMTLRTPKQMEVYSTFHPNPDGLNTHPSQPSSFYPIISSSVPVTRVERLAMPDTNYSSPMKFPVTNTATLTVVSELPSLRPRCLFLYGSASPLSQGPEGAAAKERNLRITGNESGGSGGSALGCVTDDQIQDGGHLFPFEKPVVLGERLAKWVDTEGRVWWEEKREVEKVLFKDRKGAKERQEFDPKFLESIRNWAGLEWEGRGSRLKERKSKL